MPPGADPIPFNPKPRTRTQVLLAALSGLVFAAVLHAEEAPKKPMQQPTEADKELAKRAVACVEKAQGTPGKEAANFLSDRTQWVYGFIKVLDGSAPGKLGYARQVVGGLVEQAESGPAWPVAKPVDLPFAAEAPKLDGDLSDPAWAKAVSYGDQYLLNKKEKWDGPSTRWKMMWDQKYLYFGFDCDDESIEAPQLPENGDVYNYDCVEVFVVFDDEKKQYWELNVSPTGSVFQDLWKKKPDAWGADHLLAEPRKAKIEGLLTGQKIRPEGAEKKGYAIEVAFPFSAIPGFDKGEDPTGRKLKIMLARIDKTANVKGFSALSYQPVLSWFHNVWNYGEITLKK